MSIVSPEEAVMPTTEINEKEFVDFVDQGIEVALKEHEQNLGPESGNPQVFHDINHPKAVISRVSRIFQTITETVDPYRENKALAHKAKLTELLAAFHDVDQDWTEVLPKDEDLARILAEFDIPKELTSVRSRHRSNDEHDQNGNEHKSAQRLVQYQRSVNSANGRTIYTPEDMEKSPRGILATIPGFNGKTVTQPFVDDDIMAWAMARGDLGAIGIDDPNGPAGAVSDGIKEYLETRTGVMRAIDLARKSPQGLDSLPREVKRYISSDIKKWIGSAQPSFVEGRADLLDSELDELPLEYHLAIPALKSEVFTRFPDSIAAISKNADQVNTIPVDRQNFTDEGFYTLLKYVNLH